MTQENAETDITAREAFWVNVMRLNRAMTKKEIRKKCQIGRLILTFRWGSRKNLMGRFGGGFNWQVGFEAGGRTIIVALLICSIRVELLRRNPT